MTSIEYLIRKIRVLFKQGQTEYTGIQSIQPRVVEPVYNFTTETHTYLLAEGIVVHNCDTISMLSVIPAWKPGETGDLVQSQDDDMWDLDEEERPEEGMSSYLV